MGHHYDECNHLRKQIEDMLKAGKLSHIIRELKQSSGKDQPKKKGETSGKEKPQAILMICHDKSMDGFHGGKIDISTQRNHWKARVTKDTSSTINNARNDKISVLGRITHVKSSKISQDECAMCLLTRGTNSTQSNKEEKKGFINFVVFIFIKVGNQSTPGAGHDDRFRPYGETRGCQPVRQKKKGQAAERNVAINDEVSKLVAAKIMREVHYHDWLSNPVMVKKSDFLWTEEAEAAFRQMKEHIAKLPMLTAPEEQEELIVYRAASMVAVSAYQAVFVKGQVLADFIIEDQKKKVRTIPQRKKNPSPGTVTLFTDGSSCVDDPEGVEFTYALRFQFEATNNEAEYEALIAGLRIAEKIGVQSLQVNVDSKLVANQVNGTYIAKETDMIKYLEKGIDIAGTFPEGTWESQISKVALDYFSKWIEAKPVATITRKPSKKVCMGKHRVQIRSSGRNHIRQWEAIPRQPIQRLV
ncbi:reverse transcriptase domain-containing protein [Tanacetum coccineum]